MRPRLLSLISATLVLALLASASEAVLCALPCAVTAPAAAASANAHCHAAPAENGGPAVTGVDDACAGSHEALTLAAERPSWRALVLAAPSESVSPLAPPVYWPGIVRSSAGRQAAGPPRAPAPLRI